MNILYSGPLRLSHGQASIELPSADPIDLGDNFEGQHNGLCGAAAVDRIQFITGLHTGTVGFEVQLHAAEPALDRGWHEIVEVNFRSTGQALWLMGLLSDDAYPLAIPAGGWRVRYHARNMQAGKDQDTSDEDDTIVDTYRVQLWPAADESPGRIVKETSEIAAYWHREFQPASVASASIDAARAPSPPRSPSASSSARLPLDVPAAPELPGAEYLGRVSANGTLASASDRHLVVHRGASLPVVLGALADHALLEIPANGGLNAPNLQQGRLSFAHSVIDSPPRLQVWDLDRGDHRLNTRVELPQVDWNGVLMSGPWLAWRTGRSEHRMVLYNWDTREEIIGPLLPLTKGPNYSILLVTLLQAHTNGAWLLHNVSEQCHVLDSATGETRPVPVARDVKSDGRDRLVWRAPPPGVAEPVHTVVGWVGDLTAPYTLVTAPWADPSATRVLSRHIGLAYFQVADGVAAWVEPRGAGWSLMADDGETVEIASSPKQDIVYVVGGGRVAYRSGGAWQLWSRRDGSRTVCQVTNARLLPAEQCLYVGLPERPEPGEMAVYRLPL